jgi:hypothetical protein
MDASGEEWARVGRRMSPQFWQEVQETVAVCAPVEALADIARAEVVAGGLVVTRDADLDEVRLALVLGRAVTRYQWWKAQGHLVPFFWCIREETGLRLAFTPGQPRDRQAMLRARLDRLVGSDPALQARLDREIDLRLKGNRDGR